MFRLRNANKFAVHSCQPLESKPRLRFSRLRSSDYGGNLLRYRGPSAILLLTIEYSFFMIYVRDLGLGLGLGLGSGGRVRDRVSIMFRL